MAGTQDSQPRPDLANAQGQAVRRQSSSVHFVVPDVTLKNCTSYTKVRKSLLLQDINTLSCECLSCVSLEVLYICDLSQVKSAGFPFNQVIYRRQSFGICFENVTSQVQLGTFADSQQQNIPRILSVMNTIPKCNVQEWWVV